MSTPKEVFNALREQLQASSDLAYVNDDLIFRGRREALTMFPSIALEVESITEQEYAYPVARILMVVQIIFLMKIDNKDAQLCGDDDESVLGTLDSDNNLNLAIDSDRTLGGTAIHTEIQDSDHTIGDFPVRGFNKRISILFQQTRSVRT